tara:strand:- start:436 stop:1635 length:1200 start_codon:yes stop_codon:yes gene_type:complete
MKTLFKIWFVVLIGAIIGVLIKQDSGYVLLSLGYYTIEMTFTFLLLMIVILFFIIYMIIRILIRTYRFPGEVKSWNQQRDGRRAQSAMTKGLLEISEGNWEIAEKRLIKYADKSEVPLLNYLAAARAAQLQGEHERRDAYIRLAHENMPSADIAVSLTQAELQLADHQLEQALATLRHLRSVAPKHTYVLRLLRKLYEQLGDWEHIKELIPELRKRKVETVEDLRILETKTYQALMQQAAHNKNKDLLKEVWSTIPKNLKFDGEIVSDYANYLQKLGHNSEAEIILNEALKKGWDTKLVTLYGLIDCNNPGRNLLNLEALLKEHPDNPILFLALGRLSIKAQLWGKAKNYLEKCVDKSGPTDAYHELAQLLDQLGEKDNALRVYRKAFNKKSLEIFEKL